MPLMLCMYCTQREVVNNIEILMHVINKFPPISINIYHIENEFKKFYVL
jgi:hypothetical protein